MPPSRLVSNANELMASEGNWSVSGIQSGEFTSRWAGRFAPSAVSAVESTNVVLPAATSPTKEYRGSLLLVR